MPTHHATAIAYKDKGILLRGSPGAGKSDLAARLIMAGAELVADDQVIVEKTGNRLIMSCPVEIAGLIELRGVGLMALPFRSQIRLDLIVDLVDGSDQVERLPEPRKTMLEQVAIPTLCLAAFEVSTTIKIIWMIERGVVANNDIPVAGVSAQLRYKKGP